MGVQHLWDLVEPYEKTESLKSLEGKILAIDLSTWVVEAQTMKMKHIGGIADNVFNAHLRITFYRISRLLINGVIPVVVLDPSVVHPLKVKDFDKRLKARDKYKERVTGEKVEKRAENPSEKRFRSMRYFRECEELLGTMGVRVLKQGVTLNN